MSLSQEEFLEVTGSDVAYGFGLTEKKSSFLSFFLPYLVIRNM